jgi:pimeloyl-ACP methyl ester carboxylesterase
VEAVKSLDRRSFFRVLGASAGAAAFAGAPRALAAEGDAKPSSADVLASRTPPDLRVLDLALEGDKRLATRVAIFVPNHLAPGEKVPLLVLLHGLGETWDQGVGAFAWVERYGLGTAYARLRRPLVTRTSRLVSLLPDARLAELNASLAARPFRGLAIACPYTPNVVKLPDPAAALDAYAGWVADVVVPRARSEAPVFTDAAHTSLDGVSLGGYLGLEVFVRRPDVFGALGLVQSAMSPLKVPVYAEKIAAIHAAALSAGRPPPTFHIETTHADPMHDLNLAFANELTRRGVANDFVALPGSHDQTFLREAGSMEMLLWHDRRPR